MSFRDGDTALPARQRFDLVIVNHPERWWSASRKQLVDQGDPDLEDGVQRYADRDSIRWHLLADFLSQVAAKLDAADYMVSEVLPNTVVVFVDSDPDGYTPEEALILESWFDPYEFPRADAWETRSGNGRHRLHGLWAHSPGAALPVRSHLLDFMDDIGSEHLASTIRTQAEIGLAQLPAVVRERSPHYVLQLQLAMRAVFDPDAPTWSPA